MRFLTLEGFARLVRPFKIRLSNMLSRGVVKRTNDAPGVQEIQAELLADEVRDELEHMQHFGFASHADEGAECLVAFPGGDRSMGFVLATADRRYRVKVEKGEVALYDKAGSKVLLKQNGTIEITPSGAGIVALAGASHPVAKADDLNTAITNLGTAIGAAVTAMGGGLPGAALPMVGGAAAAAGTAINTAVGAFNVAASAALSTKVKLS